VVGTVEFVEIGCVVAVSGSPSGGGGGAVSGGGSVSSTVDGVVSEVTNDDSPVNAHSTTIGQTAPDNAGLMTHQLGDRSAHR
jgi:hypothetical protein